MLIFLLSDRLNISYEYKNRSPLQTCIITSDLMAFQNVLPIFMLLVHFRSSVRDM